MLGTASSPDPVCGNQPGLDGSARALFENMKILKDFLVDDLQCAFILLALIAQHQQSPSGNEGGGNLLGDDRDAGPLGLSLYSLAKATGLPRSTARRKIHILMDNGFVTRGETGHFSVDATFLRSEKFRTTLALIAENTNAAGCADASV